MNPDQIKRIFPNASKDLLAANAGNEQPSKIEAGLKVNRLKTVARPINAQCTLTLTGQVRGGKNHMGVNRETGRHYARAPFRKWRDEAVGQIRAQLPDGWAPLSADTISVSLTYTTGDRRRRDMPAVLDALWHVLEKAGVVEDDSMLWVTRSSRRYDKAKPGVVMVIGGAP